MQNKCQCIMLLDFKANKYFWVDLKNDLIHYLSWKVHNKLIVHWVQIFIFWNGSFYLLLAKKNQAIFLRSTNFWLLLSSRLLSWTFIYMYSFRCNLVMAKLRLLIIDIATRFFFKNMSRWPVECSNRLHKTFLLFKTTL